MDFAIDVSEDGRYVVVRVQGDITRERAQEFARQALERAKARGIGRFLYDLRGARNVEDPADNYFFAYQDLGRIGRRRDDRSALLVAPEDRSHDFVETIIKNAGYNTRLFREEAAALWWLTEA